MPQRDKNCKHVATPPKSDPLGTFNGNTLSLYAGGVIACGTGAA